MKRMIIVESCSVCPNSMVWKGTLTCKAKHSRGALVLDNETQIDPDCPYPIYSEKRAQKVD